MQSLSFSDLHELVQQNLVGFLRIEVDLATTFCGMAERAESPARREKLVGDLRKAVDAIRHFSGRVQDAPTRTKLSKSADKLEEMISRIGSGT